MIRVTLLARTLRRNDSSVNIAIRAELMIFMIFSFLNECVVSMIGFAAFLATMLTCGLG